MISAIKIVNAWMNNREKAVHLFIALAREIVDGITEDQLWEVENFILVPGCDVRVEKLHGALMQLAPVPNSLDKSLQRPIMFFRASFLKYVGDTDSALANRQEFVHIVKILHEYAHMLTSPLMHLQHCMATDVQEVLLFPTEKSYDSPPQIGMMGLAEGDIGSRLEELLFGGRIVIHKDYMQNPYKTPLQLRNRPYEDVPPSIEGNSDFKSISDAFIASFLSSARDWPSTQILPSFIVPADHLIQTHYSQALTRDEALKHFPGSKKEKAASFACYNLQKHKKAGSHDAGLDDSDSSSEDYDERGDNSMLGGPMTPEQRLKRLKFGYRF